MTVNFAIGAVLLLCVGQMVVMANDFNGIKYKLDKVNSLQQVELSLMRSKCASSIGASGAIFNPFQSMQILKLCRKFCLAKFLERT